VRKALKLTKNRSAMDTNGCPYKLWRMLDKKHDIDTKEKRLAFNIIKTLTLVFQDI
jgi:hypothetical protein